MSEPRRREERWPAESKRTDRTQTGDLRVFWKRGESTAAEIRETLAKQANLAYTTVATLVRILTEKGFVEQTNAERAIRYPPICSFDDVSAACWATWSSTSPAARGSASSCG